MYQYDDYDRRIITERAHQFRGQVARRLSGEITEEEFKILRLQNGLYMQLHAYMLRVAIPYGLLSSTQVRRLAHIARTYDRGYAHLTTRQNIQYNWPKLSEVPSILDELAAVEMHAVQTSGNCVRNISSDPFAGIARDELEDPRPFCEILRQWSTFHPEFAHLPRKFKIAVTGTPGEDRAAVRFHDIGLRIVENAAGERGFEVIVGGGLGRTPVIGEVIREFLPKRYLLSYIESILRVYNLYGRRDNKFKARIKILVTALGVAEFRRRVDADWEQTRTPELELPDEEIARVSAFFAPPPYEHLPTGSDQLAAMSLSRDRELGNWVKNNVVPHKVPGYSAVVISVKVPGIPPGDVSDTQLDSIADVADRFSFGHVVVTHAQNLVLTDVKTSDLPRLHAELVALDLGKANAGKLTDVITCPGLDYCDLANARSIPLSLEIAERFDRLDYLNDVGEVSIKISGCINACGHHHIGNIGILGIDKRGEEFYQLMLGGSPGNDASIGKILGAALAQDAIVDAVEKVLDRYLSVRESPDERFLDTVRRVGFDPFRDAVYGSTSAVGGVTVQIIRNRAIVEDDFVHVADAAELPSSGKPIVTLSRYVADREALLARYPALGVRVGCDKLPADIPEARRLALIAIEFPRFSEGRPYSVARQLRDHVKFGGELRAVGWVLRDQLYYMERCGFTAFELKPGKPLESALEAFGEFSETYQAAVDDRRPIYRRR